MAYVLLTGATGLLGRYLIKDLIVAGLPVAVLVRPSRRATAWHRVENVMCYWESRLERSLPRPVVLEGDITEADLGLDARSMRWVAENCDAMLHNAASLTFQSTGPASEPWRSNVQGTANVLELCRNARIRQFHHVSTAYVCGLRQGRIFESELDLGQQMSNDYEQSKIQSETMVRSAEFLRQLTVYRPAIIIGDSQTGYTTTYHGFYAPLQAAYTMARTIEPNATGRVGGSSRFALTGHETKNLVPVDWVSAVMAHVIARPEHHGRTYHLTPQHPVTARLLGDVLEEAAGFYGVKLEGGGQTLTGLTEYEQLFCELIRVYSSYWKDDPAFDATNTRTAAPHLPCPHVSRKMLLAMAEYAIGVNFTSPRAKPVEPPFDSVRAFESLLEVEPLRNGAAASVQRLGLRITGHGGGDWSMLMTGDDVVAAEPGLHAACGTVLECDVDSFAALANGSLDVEPALDTGRIRVVANGADSPSLVQALRSVVETCQPRVAAT